MATETIHLHRTGGIKFLSTTARKRHLMTDEDRRLLFTLKRLTDACGEFCAGVIENDLSREEQLAFSAQLADMAQAIRNRALSTPVVIESDAI
ncbi:MAG: hypothetical protein M3R63_03645 [Actinomycetota bacterium]|nr:hypothetical protein [Actinomycetota bacterium]